MTEIRTVTSLRTKRNEIIHSIRLSMPTHDSLGPDDCNGVKNAKTATIKPNEQRTVDPTQMHSTWRALLQNIELMPQYQDFGFQPRRDLKQSHSMRTKRRPIAII